MKKILLPAIAAITMALTGCSQRALAPEDTSPIQLNKNDSFAMQVLKSGFDYVPFNIKDAEVPEDAYYNTLGYGTMTGLGFLANGGMGALSGFGMAAIINAGGNINQDYVHYIAWVPADNIDITDTNAINSYIHEHYLSPAVKRFVNSDFNKKMTPPTEIVKNDGLPIEIKGSSCFPITTTGLTEEDKIKYNECSIYWVEEITPIRYATIDSGLPFEPEVKAERYIVVRITDGGLSSVPMAPYLTSNMIYVYMPAFGYKASPENLNRFSPSNNPIVSQDMPFVMGADQTVNLFLKYKK